MIRHHDGCVQPEFRLMREQAAVESDCTSCLGQDPTSMSAERDEQRLAGTLDVREFALILRLCRLRGPDRRGRLSYAIGTPS